MTLSVRDGVTLLGQCNFSVCFVGLNVHRDYIRSVREGVTLLGRCDFAETV